MKTLGARIRHARTLAKLSQGELGKALGVSREAVSLWESDTNAPTMDKLGPLARRTGVPAEWLLKGGPLDPMTLRPAAEVRDELLHLVEGLTGKKRKRALAVLLAALAEEPEEPPQAKKAAS